MPRKLNIALLGHGFMGKAHSYAYLATPFFFNTGILPVRKVIWGPAEGPVKQAAEAFGFEEHSTDWRAVVRRPDIDVVDIVTPPGTHAEMAIAAAEAGKHIFCEKPFVLTVEEAEQALAAVRGAGVKHMLGFNYRRVPALALAKQFIDSGRLGTIYHYRAVYLQDWIMDPRFPRIWKLTRAMAGAGPHFDLNSHIIDLALYLVGRIRRVVGMEETFIRERPAEAPPEQLSTMLTAQAVTTGMEPVDVDDSTAFLARFVNGALGAFEATRFAAGRRNHNRVEVNGSKGSVYFDLEDMNRLQYYSAEDPNDAPASGAFRPPKAAILTLPTGGRPGTGSVTRTRSSTNSRISFRPSPTIANPSRDSRRVSRIRRFWKRCRDRSLPTAGSIFSAPAGGRRQ
jgi:predicted dehydrogenase